MQVLLIPVVMAAGKVDRPRTEMDVIEARIASARKWAARRRILRLRAALFGRRKLRKQAGVTENEGRDCACVAAEAT
jgi:hypothetical protein